MRHFTTDVKEQIDATRCFMRGFYFFLVACVEQEHERRRRLAKRQKKSTVRPLGNERIY